MDAVAVLRGDGAAKIRDGYILSCFELRVEIRQATARDGFNEFSQFDFLRVEAVWNLSRLDGGGAEGHGDDSCECEKKMFHGCFI